jgi:hypothetical protein
MARIILVAEPPAGPRVAQHLRDHGEVTLVRPKEFTTVPVGTEWVLVMNGGPHGAAIATSAGRAGAKCISIPPGWSQAVPLLDRVGFFKKKDPGPLTVKPFAGLAGALEAQKRGEERKAQEREENERKAREAVERASAPPPPDPVHEEEEEAIASSPPDEGKEANMQTAEAALTVRRLRTVLAEDRMRTIFEWNPHLSVKDAAALLAATDERGRGISWDRISTVRDEVRKAKGLSTDVRIRSKVTRGVLLIREGAIGPTQREDEAPADSPAVSVAATPPPTEPPPPKIEKVGASYAIPLPPDVEAAVRLLREALEQGNHVAAFALTFREGEKAKIRWQPKAIEFDTEV